MNAVENSLKRLKTDHIDIYLVHRFDPQTPLEETISALDDLVKTGKVRYVGCCNYAAWLVCKALWVADRINATPFMCVQNPYNLMDRHLEREMFALVCDQGLGVMVYSPLAIGLLSGTYGPDQPPPDGSLWATFGKERYREATRKTAAKVITTVHELARECGKTPAQLALAWVLSHPEVTVAITGGDTIAHIEDNVGALGWTLGPDVRETLDAVSAPFDASKT